jgi:hypothetical protein
MSLNQVLPFVTSLIILVFVVKVFQRYFATRKAHFLFWGIGLAMFGIGSFTEAYLSLAWSQWAFFGWYLCGAILTAAWIGHGTLNLLVRKRWAHLITALLLIGSVAATVFLLEAIPTLDEAAFTTNLPVSEQYGTKALKPGEAAPADRQTEVVTYRGEQVTVVRGLLPLGSPVRLTTPFFNIYGLLTLVGGAIWSAYLFWRKEVLLNRVWGNVLIAGGALLISFASTLTRLGYGQFLYIGELLAAILMFWGFEVASKPQPERVKAKSKKAKSPAGDRVPPLGQRLLKFDQPTWGSVLIILGVLAWAPFFYLLSTGNDPSIFPFLAAHLTGVLSGGWLRSRGAASNAKDESRNLRLTSTVLIYLGVLAWAPYFYLTRVAGLEMAIAPFLATHLTGVLGGLGLRVYIDMRKKPAKSVT